MGEYVPIEYPKWIDGVVVRNAAEEQAHRAALERSASAVTVQAAPLPSGKILEPMQIDAVRARIVELLTAKPAAPAESAEEVCNPGPARPLTPTAERMRRARRRRRYGLRVIPFEIRDDEIGGLLKRGLLEPVACNDRDAIASALGRLFDTVPPERWPVPAAR
jgi:hypothetical protein